MHYDDWYVTGDGFGWWILMPLSMIAFWGGIIWFAVAAIQRPNHNQHSVSPEKSALSSPSNDSQNSAREILEMRLAKGEIELDDYRQRLNALQSTN